MNILAFHFFYEYVYQRECDELFSSTSDYSVTPLFIPLLYLFGQVVIHLSYSRVMIHGANHRYTTSTTETTSKGHSSSREIQVPHRSSHEGRGPYQEQNKEKQFHT